MKKAVLIFACASLLACAGLQKKPASFTCEFPNAEEIVVYDDNERQQAMNYYGHLIAKKMGQGLQNRATAVDINLFVDQHNVSQIGQVWAERRKDGFYVCSHFIYCDLEGKKIYEDEECNRIGVVHE